MSKFIGSILRGITSTSSNNGLNPSDTSPRVPEQILVFRTITTLLAMVQQQPQNVLVDEALKAETREQRIELKVLNALATIIVMDKEVVAVAAEYRLGDGKFGIVASKQVTNLPLPSGSTPWNFLISMNPRKDAAPSIYPSLDNPKVPPQLQRASDDSQALINYVHERW